jgi:hypothetical protein
LASWMEINKIGENRRPMQSRLCIICYEYHLHRRVSGGGGCTLPPIPFPNWFQK